MRKTILLVAVLVRVIVAAKYATQRVKVTGTLNEKARTIKVRSIESESSR